MKRIFNIINILSIVFSQRRYHIFRKIMVDFYRIFENIIFMKFLDRKFTLNKIKLIRFNIFTTITSKIVY